MNTASVAAAAPPAPGRVGTWIAATRPRTITASVVPVAVGSVLAARAGVFRVDVMVAALVSAMFIQVGTNLVNDYYDFIRGADGADRVGPARVTANGWLTPQVVIRAAMACFGIAFIVGMYLVSVGGMPIVVIGLASLAAGYAYTGGPYPLAYNGLGDVFVFTFFGPVAVCGMYFLHAHDVSALAWAASVPVGALATALLVVNNLRDIHTDVRVNKRTLAVRMGERATRIQYVLLLAASLATPVVMVTVLKAPMTTLIACAAAVAAIPPLKTVMTSNGAILNGALAGTARLHMVFGLLMCAGLLLGG